MDDYYRCTSVSVFHQDCTNGSVAENPGASQIPLLSVSFFSYYFTKIENTKHNYRAWEWQGVLPSDALGVWMEHEPRDSEGVSLAVCKACQREMPSAWQLAG